jgi:hypothetical protein
MFPSLPPYAALSHVYVVHKQDVGNVWPFLVQINGDLASLCFALGELHLFLELQHRFFLLLFVLHQEVDDCSWCISFEARGSRPPAGIPITFQYSAGTCLLFFK